MHKKPSRQAKAKSLKPRKVTYNGDQLDAEFFQEFIKYDPDTGHLIWVKPLSNRAQPGSIAGYKSPDYVRVGVKGCHYMAHRVAWLLHTGAWPKEHIDHINGDKYDNRIVNLRECTYGQNAQNRLKKRTKPGVPRSKYIGVYWSPTNKKWQCTIGLNGVSYYLGHFESEEDAHRAYVKKKNEIHDFKEIRHE